MTAPDPASHRPAVVGAGVMGSTIATLALGHGLPVVLVDVDQEKVERARGQIAQSLRHAGLLSALPDDRPAGELKITTSIGDIAGATVVIEAVTETFAAKHEALSAISEVVPPGTPLVSNTSGIPIGELAAVLPRPADLVGTHFMNPAYLITMVELARAPRTAESTVTAVKDLLAALDRKATVVRDSPGFVTSRLLHPMINDAARLVDEGVATAEEVDALMRGCLGHPTGPLRTADLIGLDNLVDSLVALHERTGEERYRPCALLLAKVKDDHLGRKTGRGFYDYGKVLS